MVKEVTIKVEGMSCSGCANTVKKAISERVQGVLEAEVDLRAGRARVKYNPEKTGADRIVASVIEAGYSASLL